jgi:hypothetical protein
MPLNWTQYQYNYSANATAQTLMFGFMCDPSGNNYWFLDDVSVVDVNAPSIELLQNHNFDNSTSTLTGWTQWCTSTCTSGNAGQVTSDSNCTSTNCYIDRCYGSGAIDFLSQTFSTTPGNVYTISFWIKDFGSGSNVSSKAYVDIY